MLFSYTRAFGLLVAVVPAICVVACSSDDGDGLSSGSTGSGTSSGSGSGGTTVIGGVTGSGGTNGTPTNQDGGVVDLSADEADAIADAACAGWSAEGENLPAALQLVVDVSGSMDDPAPGTDDDDISKWDVTRDALEEAIAALPASVSLGVLYYPNRNTGDSDNERDVSACVEVDEMVPMGVLGDDNDPHREDIMQSLQQADTGSLTPTHDAYWYALENGLIPYETDSRKFMLLITDGAPTMERHCIGGDPVDDRPTQPIIDEVARAAGLGINTFIIGSPGSEQSSQQGDNDMRPWLSQAAIEGGTAAPGCDADGPENFCHMDMTQEPDFAAALTAGLNAVVGQIVDSCTFTVPEPPAGETIQPDLTNLVINWSSGSASLVLPDGIGDCTQGWQFNANGEVVLCSQTCEDIKADAGATVQLTFGCKTEDVIPVR